MRFIHSTTLVELYSRNIPAKVSTQLAKWFRNRSCLKKLLTDARTHARMHGLTMEVGHHISSHLEHCPQVSYTDSANFIKCNSNY